MTEGHTRRLQAILAADVVGYSRLMSRDEEGTLGRLKALEREAVDPPIAEHGGEVVKRLGDGLLATFPSAVAALRAARAIQQRVGESQAGVEAPITYRIGLNVGDVIVTDDDIFGDGVNVAARLEGLADAGGIAFSSSVHDNVRAQDPGPYDDLGEQRLKNLDHPVRVYRVRLDGSPPLAAAVTAGRSGVPRGLLWVAGLLALAAVAAWALWPEPSIAPPAARSQPPAPAPAPDPAPQQPVATPAPVERVAPAPTRVVEPTATTASREAPEPPTSDRSSWPGSEPAATEPSTGTGATTKPGLGERLVDSIAEAVELELLGPASEESSGKTKKPPGKSRGKGKNK
jgi:class 3 adenylate cyclase